MFINKTKRNWHPNKETKSRIIGTQIFWKTFFRHSIVDHHVFWEPLYCGQPYILRHRVLRWTTMSFKISCKFWNTLYCNRTCIFRYHVLWTILYFEIPCIVNNHVFWDTMYCEKLCILRYYVLWTTMYFEIPCFVNNHVF